MKKIFFLIFLLPIFAFAQTKANKNPAATKQKPAATKDKPKPKEKQPPKVKPVAKPIVKAKPVAIAKPVVKTIVKAKSIVKEKSVVKVKPLAKPVVKAKPKTAEPVKPLTANMHTVGARETLYGISRIYSVKVEELKKWNKLTTDDLVEGMELIVGFGNEVKQVKEVEPVETVVVEPVVKDEPKIKINTKLPETKEVVEDAVNDEPSEGKNFKGGFFKSLYKDNGKILEGVAGVFKSTSGWDDGKYYCLHNSAKQGTIIKITSIATGKSVFAKVLDIMPSLKQNDKLLIRISSAAADALGEVVATSMNVAIAY